MLSIKAIKSVKEAKQYFTEQDNYYLKDSPEAKDASRWLGNGAELLGLRGPVDAELFQNLLEGKLPDGTQLGRKIEEGKLEHRPGWDLTFSAPKSVSILAEVGQDKRLYEAHDKAVAIALSYIERACAQARKMSQGKATFENTQNLIAATFRHDTSRALDPNMHTHAVIMNMTKRKDDLWRSMASDKFGSGEGSNGFIEQIYENKVYFGAIYRSELAYLVKQAGYDIVKTQADGRFEIAGVPKEVIDHYSTRRKDIEDFLKKKGWEGSKAAAFAALETRDQKQAMDREALREGWLKGCQDLNFDPQAFIAASFSKQTEKNEPIANLQPGSAEVGLALTRVIEQLAEQDVRLSHHRVLNGLITETLGNNDPKDAIVAIEKAVEKGELIPLAKNGGELSYTTKEQLKVEEQLIETVVQNQHRVLPLLKQLKVNQFIQKQSGLSEEQKSAIHEVFSSCDRFIAINGISGSGKSKLLGSMAELLAKEKVPVHYLTTRKVEAKNLQIKNLSSDTVSAFLSKLEPQAKLKKQKPGFILIDNAQQLSSKQMKTLFQHAEKINSQMILAGDTRGYLHYGAGSAFEQLIKSGIKTRELHDIQRKLTPEARTAVKDTLEGNLKSALEKIGHRFIELNNEEERLGAIVKQYAQMPEQERKATLVLMPSKQISFLANCLIRNELKNKKILAQKEEKLTVLLPQYLTDTQKKYAKNYETGFYLRFNEKSDKFKIKRGGYYQITAQDPKHNILKIKDEQGHILDCNPEKLKHGSIEVFKAEERQLAIGEELRLLRGISSKKIHSGENIRIKAIKKWKLIAEGRNGQKISLGRKDKECWHFDYAYSATPQSVQHQQPKHIIAHHPSAAFQANQRQFYKILTQASEDIWLYTDNKDDYLQALKNKTGDKLTAIDALMMAAVENGDKLTFIVDKEKSNKEQLSLLKGHISKVMEAFQKEHKTNTHPTPEKSAAQAAQYAIQHLAERDVAFSHKALLEVAVTYALGDTQVTQIEKAIADLEKSGDLIKGVYRTDGTRWTTQAAINCEEQLLKIVRAGEKQLAPIATQDEVSRQLQGSLLGLDQQEAAKTILSSEDRFIILQAPPGSGKTTLMRYVKSIAEAQGFSVKGVAPTHGAVRELEKEGISSQTLQSFLIEARSANESDKPLDFSKQLFILDETSLISNQDCLDFVKIIDRTGARAVESGDNRQHLSPEGGNPFDLQQKAGIKTTYLTEIRRQKKDRIELREAVELTMARDYRGAIEAVDTQSNTKKDDYRLVPQTVHGKDHRIEPPRLIEMEDRTARLQAMADDYLARGTERRNNTILIAPRNEDRVLVNSLIREGMKERGQLAKEGENFKIWVAKHLTLSQLTHPANYEIGDELRFNRGISALGIKNGSYLSIVGIEAADTRLVLRNKEGKYIHWQLNHLPVHQQGALEVYRRENREICIGDKLRFTRSDKKQGFIGGDQSTVVNLTKDTITLQNQQGKTINLDVKNPKHFHWDHAYAFTSYAIQGAGKPEVISHEDSKYRNLSSQRAFLVNLTRAKQQFTLYTDNKENLIKRISKTTGNKHIALEVVGKLKGRLEGILPQSQPPIKRKVSENSGKTWDAQDISNRLTDNVEQIIENMLGEPKKKTGREWRYGSNKGSLIFTLQGEKRGFWYDHQTGEGGHLLSLIAKHHGYSIKGDFRKVLDIAAGLLGLSDSQKVALKQAVKPQLPDKAKSDEFLDKQKKSIERAKKLVEQSHPIEGTLAEKYLREHRGITKPLPESLRYHPGISSYLNGKTLPALLVIGKNEKQEIQGVQAIYLDPNTANKAKVEVVKQSFGVICGSPVTLQEGKSAQSPTLICEGIETGLSLKEADSDKAIKVTMGVSNFLNIPKSMLSKEVVFCLDNDGSNQTNTSLLKAAYDRLFEDGKTISTNKPEVLPGLNKTDYNDVLKNVGKSRIAEYINNSAKYHSEVILKTPEISFEKSKEILNKNSLNNLLTLNELNKSMERNSFSASESRFLSLTVKSTASSIKRKNVEKELGD